MRGRTLAREIALKLAYQLDLRGEEILPEAEAFIASVDCGPEPAAYARRLLAGCWEHRHELDSRISDASRNWSLSRLTAVDRNVLRIGAFELLYIPDTPPKVVLNEAVELARRFGSEESPAFVNGVLDRIRSVIAGETPE